jgi:hypothetical protein
MDDIAKLLNTIYETQVNNMKALPSATPLSSGLDKNSKKLEKGTTKNDLGVDLISRNEVLNRLASIAKIKAKSDAQKSLMGRCMFMVERMPSVTPQLSVPEVTALAEWTEKLTKASEDAYNKGYADGMKAQAEHESLCKEEREINKEKAIEILRADNISSYSVEDILNARDIAIKALEQEPFKPMVEVDLDYVINKKYIERDVLGKIRAEIEDMDAPNYDFEGFYKCQSEVLQIIDKHKAESEE